MAPKACGLMTSLDDSCLLEVAKQLATDPIESAVADLVALAGSCRRLGEVVNTREVWKLVRCEAKTVALVKTSHRLAHTARQALKNFIKDEEMSLADLQDIPLPNLRDLEVSLSLLQSFLSSWSTAQAFACVG